MPFRLSLASRMTSGGFPAISSATFLAAAGSSSRSTTSRTDPYECSSSAVAVCPVYMRARIRCWGTSRDRCVAAPRAPRSTSGRPKVASEDARRMSAFPAIPIPPPKQNPCTAAITGTLHSYTDANASAHPRFTATMASGLAWSSLRSTPAQNPRPSARMTTTRISGFSPSPRTMSASWNHAADGNALTGGTSMTTSATPPETSCWMPICVVPDTPSDLDGTVYATPVTSDFTLQELSDRVQIRELLDTYAAGIDTRDWALLVSRCTPD